MNIVVRLIVTLVCLAVMAFCAFGFLATFEPLPAATQWTWRAIYGCVAALATTGIVAINVWFPRSLEG